MLLRKYFFPGDAFLLLTESRTVWRTRFGRGYGPVVRQTTEWRGYGPVVRQTAEWRGYGPVVRQTTEWRGYGPVVRQTTEWRGYGPVVRQTTEWMNGNIKMRLKETGWDCVDCINLAEVMDRWRALVTTLMNLRVAQNEGNFRVGEEELLTPYS
jgi:hypothetical protein